MTKRVLRHWRATSAAELAEGMSWYDRAADSAEALAAGAPITREQAAAVIAALSPRCQWAQNVKAAARMVDAASAGEPEPTVAGTYGNRRKAWRILQAPGDPLEVLGGPKVRAFYANITGDPYEVTVDVWAARAAEGKSDPRAPEGKRYQRIANAYRAAAEIEGVTPREMQAAVWVRVRALTT